MDSIRTSSVMLEALTLLTSAVFDVYESLFLLPETRVKKRVCLSVSITGCISAIDGVYHELSNHSTLSSISHDVSISDTYCEGYDVYRHVLLSI